MKGDGKCYFPCNDCRVLWTRIILRTSTKKHCKEKGHARGGYEYNPLVRRYSLNNVLLVIVLIMYSHFFYHFKYMCCILYTNVIELFINIKAITPRCQPPESYLEHNSRNTTLQDDEHGDNTIEDWVLNDPMDKDDVIDTNGEDEINRLLQDIFAPLDEDNLHDFNDVPLLEKSQEPLYEGSTSNIISAILLLVKLKVLNGLSNTCFTRLLRYVNLTIFLYF